MKATIVGVERRLRVSIVVLVIFCALLPVSQLSAQTPEIQVLSPMPGEKVIGDAVGIYFTINGMKIVPAPIKLEEAGKHPEANRTGEGHLHLMLDLLPTVVWDRNEPYVFNGLPAGDHVLMIELVQNDHSSFNPPLVQEILFTSVEAPLVPSIMPNTGNGSLATQPITFFLVGVSSVLVIAGAQLRRRSSAFQ